jgi:hypothetical protein
VVADAVRRNSRQAVRKLCEVNSSGDLTFRHQPPLIWRYAELPSDVLFGVTWRQRFDLVYAEYLKSVRPELSRLLSQFRMSDCAFKAVGVGSVGTRCSIGVLVLQSKQAEPSVLAPYVDQPSPEHQGQRVVQGQRLMQTASDPFLGWTTTPGGKLCAWTLAKAHARSGDRRAIAAHIDEPKRYAQGVPEQAMHHADLAEADHQSFLVSLKQSPGAHGARAPCCCHSPIGSPGYWRRNSGSD